MQKKLIILDLDGTMVDSVPDLTLCINEMLTTLGYITSIELQVRNWVGNGIERLVQRALTQVMAQEPSALLLNRALTIFRELYSQHNTKFSQLYPGVLHTLDELKAQGYHLACVTNKAQCFVTPLLEAMQLTAYLTFIVAGDTLQAKKPDPSPLLHAINNFGVNLEQTVMVGDSINDVQAARAARIAVICVSYGYNHGRDIRESQPDIVIDSFSQLPTAIASMN